MDTKRRKINILLLEDNVDDAELIDYKLKQSGISYNLKHVSSKDEYEKSLTEFDPHIILSDYSLPTFNGLKALSIARQKRPDLPYIFVSGHIGEERAIEALTKGARDYVLKDKLQKLVPTILRVIEETEERQRRIKAEESVREAEEKYRTLFRNSYDAIMIMSDKKFVDCNESAVKIFGYDKEELFGLSPVDLSPKYQPSGELSKKLIEEKVNAALNFEPQRFEWTHLKKDGSEFIADISLSRVDFGGRINIQALIRDISPYKNLLSDIEKKANELDAILSSIPTGIIVNDGENLLKTNNATLKLLGYNSVEELNKDYDKVCAKLKLRPHSSDYSDIKFNHPLQIKLSENIVLGDYDIQNIKTGALHTINISGAPINLHDKPIGTVRILKDITESLRIEEELQEQKQILSRVLDTMPIAVIRADKKGNVVYANDAFYKISGTSKSDKSIFNRADYKKLKGRYYETNEPVAENDIPMLKAIRNKEIVKNQEIIFKNDNGSELILNISAYPLISRNKEFLGAINVIRDVTSEKAVMKEISESRQIYKSLFDYNSQGLFAMDTEGKITNANNAIKKLLGYTNNEILGKHFGLFVHPDERDYANEVFEEAKHGITLYHQIRAVSKTGEVKYLNIYNSRIIIENKVVGLYGIAEDKTAEKAAEELNERLMSIIEASPDFISYAKPNGEISYVNKSMQNKVMMNKVKDDKMLTIPEVHPKWANDLIESIALKVAVEKGFWSGETAFLAKDGSEIPTSQVILSHKDKKGNVQYFSTIARDISAFKKLENDLIQAKDKAEEMNRLKTSFLENMSHEIRTPLIGILGYSELLLEDLKGQQNIDFINSIHKSGLRLLETMNLILDLSRIEAERLDLNFRETDLMEIIKESVDTFSGMAKNKDLYLNIESKQSKIEGVTDERILREILNNLINNAIKYTKKGGVKVQVKTLNNDKNLRITIEDTGIGIDKSQFDIIFEEFRQASEGYSRKFDGTGLGLAITKKFVDKLKGDITLKSEVGVGTKFIVTIPIDIPISNTTSEFEIVKDESRSQKLRTKKKGTKAILLIEDDKINRNIIRQFLEDNFAIDIATDADQAREHIRQRNYDLILMDINLGKGESGYELTKKIRKTKKYAHIPIIAITAYAMNGDREKFIEAGCNDYLSKPFSKQELYSLINKYVIK